MVEQIRRTFQLATNGADSAEAAVREIKIFYSEAFIKAMGLPSMSFPLDG